MKLSGTFWRLWLSTASSNLSDGIGKTAFPLLAAAITRDPVQVSLLTTAFFLPWLLFALPELIDLAAAEAAFGGFQRAVMRSAGLGTFVRVRGIAARG